MSRIRIGLLSLLAAFALSAVAAGAAQAEVPTYWYKGTGAELNGNLAIKSTSGISRLWVTKLGIVIRCEKDKDTGEISQAPGAAGTNKNVTVTYTGCELRAAEWNGSEWVEGAALSLCTVRGPAGEPVGTIKTNVLKSTLAYRPPASHR